MNQLGPNLSQLGANLEPTWAQFGPNMSEWCGGRGHQKSTLGANLGLLGANLCQLGLNKADLGLQLGGSRGVHWGSVGQLFGYFLALGAVLEPRWLQDGPQVQFWSIFYRFLTIFNRFLNDFWTIFGQFLVDFLFILVDNPSIHQPINPSSPSSGTWLITQ